MFLVSDEPSQATNKTEATNEAQQRECGVRALSSSGGVDRKFVVAFERVTTQPFLTLGISGGFAGASPETKEKSHIPGRGTHHPKI